MTDPLPTESAQTNSADDTSGTDRRTLTPVRPQRNFVWLLIHVVLYLPFRFWCRTVVVGPENLDPERGGILLINHQSYLDPLFAAVRLKRAVSYLARDTLFKVPFLGWIMRHTYVIPISRTAFRGGSVRAAMERLESGFLVCMFPEGTRSSGPPGQFRPGFLSLVRRADVPVYPVAIVGSDQAMPKGAWFVRPAKVTVVYGKPLTDAEVQQLVTGNDDRQLAEMIREKVTTLYNSVQPARLPERMPD